jgi:hypothetical protein
LTQKRNFDEELSYLIITFTTDPDPPAGGQDDPLIKTVNELSNIYN